MKKPELLAPAGNMESLKAAILAGCDAVYLGGYQFGARSFAGNFSNEEILMAVEYAHLRNVKIYVTINTLVDEDQTEDFFSYVDFLYEANVDALIIQDLGMMDYIRKVHPDMELHASTQMHIHNKEGVLAAEKLGLKRVVLARETEFERIEKIKKETSIELEIFVHGALCISYSGQCFMSYFVGGRSGNRGTCAQCCRQKYKLYQENNGKKEFVKEGYLLSTRDLNTLESIGNLMEIGVDSLKIEGRMKRPEYVYFVVSLYRKAIDSYFEKQVIEISDSEIKELKKLFHRTFTKGFLFHEKNEEFIHSFRPNHLGIEIGKVVGVKGKNVSVLLKEEVSIHDGIRIFGKEDVGTTLNVFYKNGKRVQKAYPKDVITFEVKGAVEKNSKVVKTTDYEQLERIHSLLKEERRVPLKGEITIQKEGMKLTLYSFDTTITVKSDFSVSEAKTSAITEEKIKEQIGKLGDTVYFLEELKINCGKNLFVTISSLNELRRKGIEELNQKRLYREKKEKQPYQISVPSFEEKREWSLYAKKLPISSKRKWDVIYAEASLHKEFPNSILKLPRVLKTYPKVKEKVLIGDIGGLFLYQDFDTDFSIHVTNSYTLAFLHSLGAKTVTLSYECTEEDIQMMIASYEKRYHKHPNVEVIVSTYPEAMILKYNPFQDYGLEGKKLFLQDRYKKEYLLEEKGEYALIHHYEKLLFEHPEKLYEYGVSSLRVEE